MTLEDLHGACSRKFMIFCAGAGGAGVGVVVRGLSGGCKPLPHVKSVRRLPIVGKAHQNTELHILWYALPILS